MSIWMYKINFDVYCVENYYIEFEEKYIMEWLLILKN